MRERYAATREGADHVVKLTVYKPRRRSRGHVLIKNLAHCEERIFDFVVSQFLRGKLSQNLLEYRNVCSCCVVFRAQSCSEFIEKISPIKNAINNIIFVSIPK